LILGIFSDMVIFSMISFMCYAVAAYASPTAGFFYNELLLTNATTNTYAILPIVFQVAPPWMAYLLIGLAIISMLHIWHGVIDWLNARKIESEENEVVAIPKNLPDEDEDY
jgi:hypothetical protein